MLKLKLVKSKHDEANYIKSLEKNNGEKLNHGTKIYLELIEPWKNAKGTMRVVCANSYFSSIKTCIKLHRHGFNFIGVVKTATRQYPMDHLKGLEVQRRGEHNSVFSFDKDKQTMLLAVLWVDRERRYFIGNAEGVDQGEPQYRKRWQQVNVDDAFAPPEKVELEIYQPKMVKT